jgi:hypothetical protein
VVVQLVVPGFVLAVAPIINKPVVPYEVQAIDARIEQERVYLGELTNDPHTYEFAIGESKPLVLSLLQVEAGERIPLSLIVVEVEENNRGVTEIGRLAGKDMVWESVRNHALGLMVYQSQVFTAELEPGVYRFEVSSTDNIGKYLLTVGYEKEEVGYFASLKDIYTIRQFFGVSVFGLIFSSAVYYPLGILLLLLVGYVTWRKRDLIRKWRQPAHE